MSTAIYYPEHGEFTLEAQFLVFPGRKEGEFLFEKQDWWIKQIASIGNFWLKAQFGGQPVDYRNYRTNIKLAGEKETDNYRQETDTISRLVYGFATAYLLDRRRPLPGGSRERHRVPAGAHALLRLGRAHRLLVPRHRRQGRPGGQGASPPSSATTTTPSRPTSRSTPWPAPSRPTASPATPRSCATPR